VDAQQATSTVRGHVACIASLVMTTVSVAKARHTS
jgi:hypothetical protein